MSFIRIRLGRRDGLEDHLEVGRKWAESLDCSC